MSSPKSPPKSPSSGVASPLGDGNAIIEVDAADADSVYAQSAVTDTTSLRSSILAFKWENGRRYHAYQDGAYYSPNDERQQEAEDLMHEMFRIILDDKLFTSPLEDKVDRVLDIGCGTGQWAIEFADENPSSEVIGVDLSPIQPGFIPPNCKFEVDDINQDWTYPKDHFDFIHIRYMTGCIPDWVEFYKKAMDHVKPGGWVEHAELSSIITSDDGTVKQGSAMQRWFEIFREIGSKIGKTFDISETSPERIREAGLVNIHERKIKIPIGTWPKDPILKKWGSWYRQFALQGLEGFVIRGLTDLLGWSFEEVQLFLMQARSELTDAHIHAYTYMTVVSGQKPIPADES